MTENPDDPFPRVRDFSISLGDPGSGSQAFFGRDVLRGLIEGIDDYANRRQPRWMRRSSRVTGPVLLGCSPWVGDDKLISAIADLPSACVVLSKPRADAKATTRLHEVNEGSGGLPLRALSSPSENSPTKVGGKAQIIGPYDRMDADIVLPTLPSIGRRATGRARPPLAHAKLALLGNICWTDEDPVGGVTDYIWFAPERL